MKFKSYLKNFCLNRGWWVRLDDNKVPMWVVRAFNHNLPSPLNRPLNFFITFKGKTFRYRIFYNEKGQQANIKYYRKLRMRKKR